MSKDVDSTDLKIISAFQSNPSESAKSLAKKLGIHPNTLLQRLKRLERKKIITGRAVRLDFDKLGYDLHISIMMKIRKGRPGDMGQLDSLLKMHELEIFYATTGLWDILSVWRVKDKNHLNEVLTKITGHPNVTKTVSHLILHTYKDPIDFRPLL